MPGKLTKAQRTYLETLRKMDTIRKGVIWYGYYTGKNSKRWSATLDGRICEGLVRRGVLVQKDGKELGEYTLVDKPS